MPEILPPGVEERVNQILRRCDLELDRFLDNLDMVLRKKEPMTDWEREAIKKSLTVYIQCADMVLEEFR